jgi:hypothetical protein
MVVTPLSRALIFAILHHLAEQGLLVVVVRLLEGFVGREACHCERR